MSQLTLTPGPDHHANSSMAMHSPLANSTRIQTCLTNNSTNIIINNYNYNQIVLNEGETSRRKARRSIAPVPKKPVVVPRKPLAPKKTCSNVMVKSNDNIKKVQSVERILNQINMSKYANLFKNCDLNKFKQLRELDLNAMGITRPQELRTFKEAINKAKVEHINSTV